MLGRLGPIREEIRAVNKSVARKFSEMKQSLTFFKAVWKYKEREDVYFI